MHTASISSSERYYPLREIALKLWSQLGLPHIPDANNGHPQGIAELVENWRDGKRQLASDVYPLAGVKVLTESLVRRIIINEDKVAIGIELANGDTHMLSPNGKIILSAGAYRTPQVLMLSGIGDAAHLSQHGIPVVVDLPQVGRNFHDHLMMFRYWKLRNPEQGLALGSPLFQGPNYMKGGPVDWLCTSPIPTAPLKAAIERDEGSISEDHHLLRGPRSHLEMNLLYAVFGSEQIGLNIPMDGKSVMTFYMACLPTSRGSVTLASNNPSDSPVIDPNYYASEADRHVMREGFRIQSRLMLESPVGRELVAGEHVPKGYPVLESDAPDCLIDEHIKIGARTVYHAAGTAAMGTVVDGSLKVCGVKNLRVVDASIVSTILYLL